MIKIPQKAGISKDVKTLGSSKLTFRDRNTIRIEIINCIVSDRNITDNRTKTIKAVKEFASDVIDLDDNNPKEFSTLSNNLQNILSDIDDKEGLINNKLRIEKIGSGFGTKWKVESLIMDSKWKQSEAEKRIEAKQKAERNKKYNKK